MSTEETTTRLLAQLEEGMRLAPERQCPCGHRAREHRDGGCPCQDCDLRAFEVDEDEPPSEDAGDVGGRGEEGS